MASLIPPSQNPKPAGYLSRIWSAASNTAYDLAVAKPKGAYSATKALGGKAVTAICSTASSLAAGTSETVTHLTRDPVGACIDLGHKSADAWNRVPPIAKTLAGGVALCTLPNLFFWGLWKVPAAGYLAWNGVLPERAKEAIRKHPRIAQAVETVAPAVENLKQIKASAVTTVQTPIVLGGKNYNPLGPSVPNTGETLGTIKEKTLAILAEAEKAGIQRDRVDDRLPIPEPKPPVPQPAPGMPALPAPSVPVIPAATGPKELTDPADIKKKTDDELNKFCKKVSDFSTLQYIIGTICHIKEPDNTSLFQLVSAASQQRPDGTTPSLWTLLNEKYQLSFFQKLRAGLFYFWFYKLTALIPNTVETYLKCFVNEVRSQLTDQNSVENSDKYIQKIVDNANGFLKSYNDAAEDFVEGTVPYFNTLAEYRTNRIAMHYGGSIAHESRTPGPGFEAAVKGATASLSKGEMELGRPADALLVKPFMDRSREILCKRFSRKIVDTYSPHVEFFKNWKKHPFGKLFSPLYDAIESILNKYLRYAMKTEILPYSFLSIIKEGIDATSKHNLPFSIALTRFFSEQIDKLGKIAEQPSAAPDVSIDPPPAIEHLDEVVTELLTALEQVPLATKAQFRDHKKNLQAKSEFDRTIREEIRQSITEASQFLFQYLAQPANAEEMFSQLLEVSNAAFSDTAPRGDEQYKKSKADFDKRVEDLKAKSNRVFKTLVRKSVEKEVKGTPRAQEIAGPVFEKQKTEALGAFDQLHELSRAMLARTRNAEEIDLHADIASLAQIMKTFSERETSYHGIDALDPADREDIQRALAPLYQTAESAAEKIQQLQNLQKTYSYHSRIAAELSQIQLGLRSVAERSEFSQELREKMAASLAEIDKNLPHFPQLKEEMRQRLDDLYARYGRLDAEHRLLQEIERLFPKDGSQGQGGLVRNFLNYRRGDKARLPNGFRIKECRAEILRILSSYPEEIFPEAKALKNQIEQAERSLKLGKQDNLDAPLDAPLDALAAQIRQTHETTQEGLRAAFEASYNDGHASADKYRSAYVLYKQKNQTDMDATLMAISNDFAQLKDEAQRIKKRKQFLTEPKMGTGGAILTGLAAALGAAIGSATGIGTALSAASAGASFVATGLYRGIERKTLGRLVDKGIKDLVPLGAASLAAAAGAAAVPAALAPISLFAAAGAAATTVGGSMVLGKKAGSAALREAVNAGQDKVLAEVEKQFDNAFDFVTKSDREHIFHGAITRLMKTISE